MTPQELLAELDRRGVILTPVGDKLRYDAPAGVLTPDLKEAMRQHKADLLVLLRARENAKSNVFCFTCFRHHGVKARYQPHVVRLSLQYPGWLEFICTGCGSRSYARPKGGDGGCGA